jgi:asparagine synthase (glutamine-hydrolysing)
MCGIVGFIGQGSRGDLEAMATALAHRGPDGEGFFIDETEATYIGHRRLAVVDVAAGHQPMWNEDGQVAVVFNGEIYNHAELRRELERLGHHFATDHSDTEVLVHGWEEWREGLPLRLNGMFAFAILDRSRRQMFLARDRLGEKPLYYTARPGFFAFASELSGLTQHPKVSRSISQRGLQKYFGYGYIPAPNSILEGVSKLPGGSWLRYDLISGEHRVQEYWQFALSPDYSLQDTDEPRLVEELRALLIQAARRRLMSDVPIGTFLSGGLDSSLVLSALAQSRSASDLSTFTIGFAEPSFDESSFASIVAEHVGTRHHQKRLDLEQARQLVPKVLGRLDEPLGDASLLPTHLLSAFAREHVTVALTGDGGDELFAGYDPFAALGPAAFYRKAVPGWMHRGLRRAAEMLPVSTKNMSLDFKIRRALLGLSYSPAIQLPVWMSPLDPKDAKEVFEKPIPVEDTYDEAIAIWNRDPKLDAVDRSLELFTRLYLQDDILTKVDRASMMCSLETRAVFLDNDLVDFCQRLPNRFKIRNGQRKYLLKKVARTLLPASIIDRKKKGFGIPLTNWLRQMPIVTTSSLAGLRNEYVALASKAHAEGRADHRLFLWNWIVLHSGTTGSAGAS